MADRTAVRRSPLSGWSDRLAQIAIHSGGTIAVREQPFLTQLDIRATAGPDRPALPAVNEILDWRVLGPSPASPNTWAPEKAPGRTGLADTPGSAHLLGLGPDEWLAIGAPDTAGALEADLRDRLGPWLGAVVDVSAQRTALVVSGAGVRDLLAHGCALDLDPAVFGVNRCAQTMLAHAQVILSRIGQDEFQLLVRASFAGYLAAWLLDAAGPNCPQ